MPGNIHWRRSDRQRAVAALRNALQRTTRGTAICGRRCPLVEHAPVVFHAARLRAHYLPSCVEARGDHGDLHLAVESRVLYRAKDDIGLWMSSLADDVSRLVHLVQSQVKPAGDIEENAACPVNIDIQQWAGNGYMRRIDSTGLACSLTNRH